MSRHTQADHLSETQSLVSRLTQTINRIDADDLSGLAQVHGWCEALLEQGQLDPPGTETGLAAEVTGLARRLEALILGEVNNAAEVFAGLVKDINALAAQAAGAAPVSSQETPPADAVVEDTAAENLARVFDDLDVLDGLEGMDGIEGIGGIGDLTDIQGLLADPVFEQSAEPVEEPPANASATPSSKVEPSYISEPLVLDPKEMDFVKGFVEEAHEHLEAIEAAVLAVERCPDDTAKIDDLFRPFHTIKGMAGFLNLRDINCLTHEVETLLDQGRKGRRSVTAGVIDLVLSVVDVLKVQIAGVGQWVAEPHSATIPQPPVAEIIDRLRAVVAGRLDPDECADEKAGARTGPRAGDADGAGDTETAAFAPPAGAFTTAPAAQQMNPALSRSGIGQGGATSQPASPSPSASASTSSTAGASTGASGAKVGDQSIRIDTDKLDALIDMVGELVIAQTLVSMSGDVAINHKLSRDVTQVTKIVRDVQELAMAMRMVPIGPTFQKMARLVRDVSRKADKQVKLTISGEDTELDKTVIQEIGDPLVHMVRNAIDHGIESPEVRRASGKPEMGQVHLHAGHEGGNILISIRDDGKGLDAAVLHAKAIEKGVIAPTDELTEQEAFALIFAPGFSTAAQVTDISGRGVGMDVVKRNIDQLRGRVEIASEKGKGTTFSIRLPLTLAIIDGMVIRVGAERFILPTITIQQSLRPLREAITSVLHRGEVLNVRGEMIPLIQLGQLFGLTGPIDPCEAMVIIAHCEGRLVGLVVEELIGQQQVVIKTLGEQFEKLQGVSGAAILGDGRVGLILEMTGLSAAHERFTQSKRGGASPVSQRRGRAAADSARGETSGDAPASEARGQQEFTPTLHTATLGK